MGKNPLQVLKGGLSKLKETVKKRKESLLSRLREQQKISSEDEDWLDQEANFVDEEALVDMLENASDYERAVSKLDPKQKPLLERLIELGGGIKDVIVMGKSSKRKSESCQCLPKTDMGTTEVGSGPEERKVPSREKKKAEPVFTKKENATIAQRIEILDWYHKHSGPKKSQVKTAAHFDKTYPNLRLKQPIISDWVRNEVKWRKEWAAQKSSGKVGNIKRTKQTEHPQVNEMLELWVAKAMRDGIRVTGEVLRQKWHKFADLEGIPQDERLTLSEGWLTAFKRRCGLKEFRTHGEAGSVDPAMVEIERERIRKLIQKYGYRLKDIFNMDETGLFYA